MFSFNRSVFPTEHINSPINLLNGGAAVCDADTEPLKLSLATATHNFNWVKITQLFG